MNKDVKIALAVVVAVVAVIGTLTAFSLKSTPTPAAAPELSSQVKSEALVRPDSHKLSTAADGKATLVEFLDLECEACAALYPTIEKLRTEYAGKVTFVARYFPIASHRNAQLAAQAVEAAAQQGKFEGMYQKMYQNQTSWAEAKVSRQDVFVGFARDLGLDLPKFEQALSDPKTAERVGKDQQDGTSLGVTGTPTVFFNGERVERPNYETLKQKFDAALAG